MIDTIYLFCQELGLFGLFILSLLASTIIPLGSEWLLLVLVHGASNQSEVMTIVLVAVIGNSLGGIISFYLGYLGRIATKDQINSKIQYAKINTYIQRYGAKTTFFGWLPWVGDPIVVLSGLTAVPFIPFLFYSTLGRAMRYIFITIVSINYL